MSRTTVEFHGGIASLQADFVRVTYPSVGRDFQRAAFPFMVPRYDPWSP